MPSNLSEITSKKHGTNKIVGRLMIAIDHEALAQPFQLKPIPGNWDKGTSKKAALTSILGPQPEAPCQGRVTRVKNYNGKIVNTSQVSTTMHLRISRRLSSLYSSTVRLPSSFLFIASRNGRESSFSSDDELTRPFNTKETTTLPSLQNRKGLNSVRLMFEAHTHPSVCTRVNMGSIVAR